MPRGRVKFFNTDRGYGSPNGDGCGLNIRARLSAWVGSLARYEKNNRKAALSGSRAPRCRPDSWPLPGRGNSQIQQRELPLASFALLSRKLGCGACTKSHDSRPRRGRLGSSSMLARRRQARALHRRELGGLSPLQTMYQLPSPQQRQRLPPHCQQWQSGVHM